MGPRNPSNDQNNPAGNGRTATKEETADLQSQLKEAQADAAEWQDKYLRQAAEMENTRKRLERNLTMRSEQAQERLVRDLLPLVDNLERALIHAAPQERTTGLFAGVELSLRDLLQVLEKHQVERIEALGQPFNPEIHEAVGAAPHPTLPPGSVMHVELPGYTYKGRLLRPARVLVVAGG